MVCPAVELRGIIPRSSTPPRLYGVAGGEYWSGGAEYFAILNMRLDIFTLLFVHIPPAASPRSNIQRVRVKSWRRPASRLGYFKRDEPGQPKSNHCGLVRNGRRRIVLDGKGRCGGQILPVSPCNEWTWISSRSEQRVVGVRRFYCISDTVNRSDPFPTQFLHCQS